MNRLFCAVIFCAVSQLQALYAGSASEIPASLIDAGEPLQMTYRLRAEGSRGNAIVTGHGTAFAINLDEFGFSGPRYVLTACHVIRDRFGEIIPTLKIEVKAADASGPAEWLEVHVVAYDPGMDVALLKSETDLPRCSSFIDKDLPMGSGILHVGCPSGIKPTEYPGNLIDLGGVNLSAARVTFFKQGCSGGPVFDRATNKVIGIAVAGVGNGRSSEMDPHTCLFVSHERVKSFLTGCMPAGKPDAYAVDTSFTPEPNTIPAESKDVHIEICQTNQMSDTIRRLKEQNLGYVLIQSPPQEVASAEPLAEAVDISMDLPLRLKPLSAKKSARAELLD